MNIPLSLGALSGGMIEFHDDNPMFLLASYALLFCQVYVPIFYLFLLIHISHQILSIGP